MLVLSFLNSKISTLVNFNKAIISKLSIVSEMFMAKKHLVIQNSTKAEYFVCVVFALVT